MELSYFLAQLFGLTMMIFAALAFLRPSVVLGVIQDLKPFSFSMLMAGFVGIVAGLAIVLSHNIWEFSWVGVVTLFGWAALLKGITYVAFPNVLLSTANQFLRKGKQRKIALGLAFLLGLYLTGGGFGWWL